jgi:hypothetical protein
VEPGELAQGSFIGGQPLHRHLHLGGGERLEVDRLDEGAERAQFQAKLGVGAFGAGEIVRQPRQSPVGGHACPGALLRLGRRQGLEQLLAAGFLRCLPQRPCCLAEPPPLAPAVDRTRPSLMLVSPRAGCTRGDHLGQWAGVDLGGEELEGGRHPVQ